MLPLEVLLYILFPAYTVCVLSCHGLLFLMFRLLADYYPEKYEEIGRPTIFWTSSFRAITGAWFFITGDDYLMLSDPLLTKLCFGIKLSFILSLLLFAAVLIDFCVIALD